MEHISDLIRSGHKVIFIDISGEKNASKVMNSVNMMCSYHHIKAKQSVVYGTDCELNAYKILRVELECAIMPRQTKERTKQDAELKKKMSEAEQVSEQVEPTEIVKESEEVEQLSAQVSAQVSEQVEQPTEQPSYVSFLNGEEDGPENLA